MLRYPLPLIWNLITFSLQYYPNLSLNSFIGINRINHIRIEITLLNKICFYLKIIPICLEVIQLDFFIHLELVLIWEMALQEFLCVIANIHLSHIPIRFHSGYKTKTKKTGLLLHFSNQNDKAYYYVLIRNDYILSEDIITHNVSSDNPSKDLLTLNRKKEKTNNHKSTFNAHIVLDFTKWMPIRMLTMAKSWCSLLMFSIT